MRRAVVFVAATASIALALGTATSASAADTTTTFTLAGGALSITAPASKALGSGAAGGTISALLGAVQVTDARAALGASWTATVSSTDFTDVAADSVLKANVTYWSGAATASTGTVTAVPGQLLAANAVTLASSRTAFSATLTVGNNSETWNPTLTVNAPAQAIAGAYSGTVTHSVA